MRQRSLYWVLALLVAACSAQAQRPAAALTAPGLKAVQNSTPSLDSQPEAECDPDFRSALATCWTKGPLLTPSSACCTALSQLAPSCWQAVAKALTADDSDAAVKPTLDRVLRSCNLTATPLTSGSIPVNASPFLTSGSSPALPILGELRTAWVLDNGPVPCPRYNPANRTWQYDPAAATWGPTSSRAMPSDQAILALADSLCAQPSLAGAAMVQELAAGGERAQVVAAVLLRTDCVYGTDLLRVLQSDPRLLNPVTALSYIEAFVRAADQVGVGACVTAAVFNSSGAVQAWAQMHTLAQGPPADGGSSTGSISSVRIDSKDGAGGSTTTLPDSSLEGGPESSPESSPDSSSGGSESGLPKGVVDSLWTVGRDAVECSTYSPPKEWVPDMQTWAGEGGTEADAAAAEALAQMLCESSALVSGEALYAAFNKGGSAAEVAVAALLYYECPQGNTDAVLDAAFNAFTGQTALNKPDTAYRVAQNLVTAADAIGAGACVSIAVLDTAGEVLDQVQVHTSASDGSDTSASDSRDGSDDNSGGSDGDNSGDGSDGDDSGDGSDGDDSGDGSDGGDNSDGNDGEENSDGNDGEENSDGSDGEDDSDGSEYTNYSTRLLGGTRVHRARHMHVPS